VTPEDPISNEDFAELERLLRGCLVHAELVTHARRDRDIADEKLNRALADQSRWRAAYEVHCRKIAGAPA
jgi:hypothetical protein